MNRIPFKFSVVKEYDNHLVISDENGLLYSLYSFSKNEYLLFRNLKKSKYVRNSIYEYKENGLYYFLYKNSINKSENKAKQNELLKVSRLIFNEYIFKVTLKKEHFKTLSNLYQLLDNKFTYLEMRIREIELAPIKNDISWIILSKYHSILDAKVILYDLQTDILKYIEKELIVDYGLVFRFKSTIDIENGLIEPNLDYYYAPISMLYSRYYLLYDHVELDNSFYDQISKLSDFDKKYFCFMVLYIYILCLNLDVLASSQCIDLYINVCKKIDSFYKKFNSIIKK